MILIVDAGGTKTSWSVGAGSEWREIITPGINVAYMKAEDIEASVKEAIGGMEKEGIAAGDVERIFFYAAGMVGGNGGKAVPQSAIELDAILRRLFPSAEVEYASDLLGAARAVCGHSEGIAAIIGTGANTCQFDGNSIVRNIPCGGFILGDEGSGAVLGKLFVSDFLKGRIPAELSDEFAATFGADYPTIVREVYKGKAPAAYLGSFVPFILGHIGIDYVRTLVENNFRSLIERTVLAYDPLPVGVVGGFGYACRDILTDLGSEYGLRFEVFLSSPREGLLRYHGV